MFATAFPQPPHRMVTVSNPANARAASLNDEVGRIMPATDAKYAGLETTDKLATTVHTVPHVRVAVMCSGASKSGGG